MQSGSVIWFDVSRWTDQVKSAGKRKHKTKQQNAGFPWWPAVISEHDESMWKVRLFEAPVDTCSNEVSTDNQALMEKLRSKHFHDFKNVGLNSSYKDQFRRALDLCIEAESEQLDDDDAELPSFQNIKIAASTPVKENAESTVQVNNRDSPSTADSPVNDDGQEYISPSKKRKIELKPLNDGVNVLAHYIGDRKYHPATVLERKPGQKDQYKIKYWDSQVITMPRSRIVSIEDENFGDQIISPECYTYLSTMYSVFADQSELQTALESISSQIKGIYQGELDTFSRFKEFVKGGKSRANLSQRVQQGSYSKAEREFIMQWLKKHLQEEKSADDSQYEHIDLIANVVYPDTLNLLLQEKYSIDAETAEQRLFSERCDNWILALIDEFETRQKQLQKPADT